MQKAKYVTTNMVRFVGPNMDLGTAFKLGSRQGFNKPVFAYYDAEPFYIKAVKPLKYKDRVKEYYLVSKDRQGIDAFGQSIEAYEMADNLMMIGAIDSPKYQIAATFEDAFYKSHNTLTANKLGGLHAR